MFCIGSNAIQPVKLDSVFYRTGGIPRTCSHNFDHVLQQIYLIKFFFFSIFVYGYEAGFLLELRGFTSKSINESLLN